MPRPRRRRSTGQSARLVSRYQSARSRTSAKRCSTSRPSRRSRWTTASRSRTGQGRCRAAASDARHPRRQSGLHRTGRSEFAEQTEESAAARPSRSVSGRDCAPVRLAHSRRRIIWKAGAMAALTTEPPASFSRSSHRCIGGRSANESWPRSANRPNAADLEIVREDCAAGGKRIGSIRAVSRSSGSSRCTKALSP